MSKATNRAKQRPRKHVPSVSVAEIATMPALERRRIRFQRTHFNFILIIGSLLLIGTMGYRYIAAANLAEAERQADAIGLSNRASESHLFYTKRLKPLIDQSKKFEATQAAAGLEVADQTVINGQISQIETALRQDKFHDASTSTSDLSNKLAAWQRALHEQLTTTNLIGANQLSDSGTSRSQYQVPILVYHQPPVDFEQQLQVLIKRGYTTITMAQLVAAWNGASLPPKPVIITFDDGYADQMKAVDLLEAYRMKATFYIIDGGPASQWCIGAGRRYNDPTQPKGGCGDAYLNWDQIRQLDASGLITIGSHTIDHPDLIKETAEQQAAEIIGGKTELEHELGHTVRDFAYPYGDYNATTVAIVRQAGFVTAVTTMPGSLQSVANRLSMPRLRSAYILP